MTSSAAMQPARRTLFRSGLRRPWIRALSAVLTLMTLSASARADAPHSLQLNLELYSDDATHATSRNIGGNLQEDETEVGRFPAFALSLTYLLPVMEHVKLGPGVRYLSSYRYIADDSDDENDPGTLIGRMFELYARAEFPISLGDDLTLAPAIDLGVPVLFAAGDLQDDLNAQERLGYSVNGLPRIGFLVGAELGVRYHLVDFLYARAGLGLQHSRISLYDASVDGGVGEVSRSISIMRIRAVLGLEAQL